MLTLCSLLQECFPPFHFRADAARLLPQGGSSLSLVSCRGASGQRALTITELYLFNFLGCFTLVSQSHLTSGRELCFVLSCPTGTEDGCSSSKVPMATLTSSPALSTRPLPRVPQTWRVAFQAELLLDVRSHSQCISGNWDLFGDFFFFRQDYSNFVLKCVFKQLPVLMNHLPGEQAHPPFFHPSLPLDGRESRNVLVSGQELSEV